MKTPLAIARVGSRCGLLLSWALLTVRISGAAPAAGENPGLKFAHALATLQERASAARSMSKKLVQERAFANTRLQVAAAGLQKLNVGTPPVSYSGIFAVRAEAQSAYDAFERIRDLNARIHAAASSMEEAIHLARDWANVVPSAPIKIQRAQELLESTFLISDSATHFTPEEVTLGMDAADAQLTKLDALETALVASAKNPACDIHSTDWYRFKFPRAYKWMSRMDVSAGPGEYFLVALYADLNGNGQPEAIVQVSEGYAGGWSGSCDWRGHSVTYVFEMDLKCVTHRLAEFVGESSDNPQIKGRTLVVDRLSTRSDPNQSNCAQSGLRRFVWQFKAGKLRSTFTDLGIDPLM
jgi:hypothetical protein